MSCFTFTNFFCASSYPPSPKKKFTKSQNEPGVLMRLGLTIHEIYDECGPPSDPIKATKGCRSSFSPHSLSSSHPSKHGHLPLFCLHPLGFGWFADDPHVCIFTTLYSLSSDGRPLRPIPCFPSMHLILSCFTSYSIVSLATAACPLFSHASHCRRLRSIRCTY